MAQPFEQVLESLRAIASGKLGQLEERSKAYLTEIKTTIESRVESEKVKAKGRTTRAARAKKKTAKNATPVDDVEEDDVAHGEKENAVAVTRSSRRTRASVKTASNALCDATNTNVDAEDAGDASSKQPARSSRRLRSKKATTSAPPVASSGRMTRSRAKKQAQVLETIVETTENDDTSPEQSPDLGKRDEEMEEQEKNPPTPPPAKGSATAEAEVVTDKSVAAAEDVAKVPAKAKADKPQKQPKTRKSVAAATRAARKKDLSSQDDTAQAKLEDEAKVAPREDHSEPEPQVRRKSTRQRRGSAKLADAETEILAEAKTTKAVQENPVEEVEKAVDAANSEPDKAAGGKKRGRPRTKPVRQRGAVKQAPAEEEGEKDKDEGAIPEADMAARNPKKARKSAPKPETEAQDSKASASAEAPAEPNRKLRRRTRSSRMVEEERGTISMKAAPAVQQQEQQGEERAVVVPEDKEKAAHEESKMEAHLTPGDPAKGSPASTRLADERKASAVGSGAESVDKSKTAEFSVTPDPEERLKTMRAEVDPQLAKDFKNLKNAMTMQEPVHCPPNATEVLETEAAATKKAVQAAKSGGLRNMMSLLSPENEDGAGEARTLSRFDAADATELAGESAKVDQRPAVQRESSAQKQPGFVEKASNVITSVASFLPSMRKEGGLASRARKPVEVKALKAAEQARKQEALKLEEKMKRREVMKDRAVAARETKQRLEEQKRQQMLLDQQRKDELMRKRGEEIARKKRDREEESRREREEKKRKVNLELEKKKMAEMQRAQRTAAAAAQKQKQTTAPQSGGLPGTQRHGYLRPGIAADGHSKTGAAKPVKASALSQKHGQAEAKLMDTSQPRNILGQSGIHNRPTMQALANKTNTYASNPPHGGPNKVKSQKQVNLSPKSNVFAFGSKAAALPRKTPEPFPFKGHMGSVPASSTLETEKKARTMDPGKVYMTPFQKPADPHGVTSYQMTPYRSDSDESDDECRPAKPVPQWAKSRNLSKQLQMQIKIDPDEIFNMDIAKASCSLDDVFKTGKPKVFRRRGSSGDWNRDRLNWKEEWIYKQAMGYATSDA